MSTEREKDQDRIIRKIKHCLALSASSNEHEAAAAMRQAQALMQKHRLTEKDVALAEVKTQRGHVMKVRLKRWEWSLAIIVAEAMNCRCVVDAVKNEETRLWYEVSLFIGVAPAQEVAAYAYEALHTKAVHARREYVSWLRKSRGRQRGLTPETRGDHFLLGWIAQVASKLKAIAPEIEASDSTALVATETQEQALIREYIAKHMEITQIQPRAGKHYSEDLHNGAVIGSQVQLHHGVANRGEQPLTIGGSHQ